MHGLQASRHELHPGVTQARCAWDRSRRRDAGPYARRCGVAATAALGRRTRAIRKRSEEILHDMETHPGEAARLFRGISGYAPIFQKAAESILVHGKGAK